MFKFVLIGCSIPLVAWTVLGAGTPEPDRAPSTIVGQAAADGLYPSSVTRFHDAGLTRGHGADSQPSIVAISGLSLLALGAFFRRRRGRPQASHRSKQSGYESAVPGRPRGAVLDTVGPAWTRRAAMATAGLAMAVMAALTLDRSPGGSTAMASDGVPAAPLTRWRVGAAHDLEDLHHDARLGGGRERGSDAADEVSVRLPVPWGVHVRATRTRTSGMSNTRGPAA